MRKQLAHCRIRCPASARSGYGWRGRTTGSAAFQRDTAVLGEHRGHGLGMLMKAAMARWLRAERPALTKVSTTVDPTNQHVIRVNDRIGYTTRRETIEFEGYLDAVQKRLAAARAIAADGN
jgi:GNAT superfamily N-acetyltransferase